LQQDYRNFKDNWEVSLDEFPENAEGDLEVQDRKVSKKQSKYEFEDKGNLRDFRYQQFLKRRNK